VEEGLMAIARLLVVDDEKDIRWLFEDYFSRIGYDVVTAESGQDALDKFVPGEFDCVLSDMVMSGMTGMDVLRELRVRDEKILFLMMTGYPSLEDAINAMKHGAYDYITKPLNLEDVRIKIERGLHTKGVEKSLKKISGLFWALMISIPIWLILGIVVGWVWTRSP
jgi:DNA-binding NtrC family response regulator